MYTNVLMLLRTAVRLAYFYDDFESYSSGQQINCAFNSGYSIGLAGVVYRGAQAGLPGCVKIFKEIFYDNFENDSPSSREYASLFGSRYDIEYYNSIVVTGSGGMLQNYGFLAGTGTNISGNYTEGYIQSGYSFNTGYITYPHHSSMLFNDFTIELWAKRQEWLTTYAKLIDKDYLQGFAVSRANASDSVNFNILGSDNFSVGTLPFDTWTHIACVRSGSEGRIYLNGLLDSSFAVSPTKLTATADFAMAQNRSTIPGAESFKGHLDEVRLWSYARPSGQIFQNYNRKLTQKDFDVGLLIYFPFERVIHSVGHVYLLQNYFYDNFERYPSGSGAPIPYNSGVLITNYLSYSGVVTGGVSAII